MEYVLAAVVGYFCGCVPVALLVARRHGVDLYSTTATATPAPGTRSSSSARRRAWPAFVGDGAKALLPVAVAHLAVRVLARVRGRRGRDGRPRVPAARPAPRRQGGHVLRRRRVRARAARGADLRAPLAIWSRSLPRFAWAARAAVFAFPLVQLVTDPVEHVAGTGVLMTFIGVLFTLRRSAGPASASTGAAPTT